MIYTDKRAKRRGMIDLHARITLDGSGNVASHDSQADFTVTNTPAKTGRFTLTFRDRTLKFRGGTVRFLGPDDSAIAAGARDYFWRDDDMATGAKDGTIELQFVATTTDTAPPVSSTILITVHCQK